MIPDHNPPTLTQPCGCAYRILRGYPLAYTSVRRCKDAVLSMTPRLMAEHLGLRDAADEPESITRQLRSEDAP